MSISYSPDPESILNMLDNWRFDSPSVGAFEMTFGPTNGGKSCKVILHNVIQTNPNTDMIGNTQKFNAKFDPTCFSHYKIIGRRFMRSVATLIVTASLL